MLGKHTRLLDLIGPRWLYVIEESHKSLLPPNLTGDAFVFMTQRTRFLGNGKNPEVVTYRWARCSKLESVLCPLFWDRGISRTFSIIYGDHRTSTVAGRLLHVL